MDKKEIYKELVKKLARSMSEFEIDPLIDALADGCLYKSDYHKLPIVGKEKISEHMRRIAQNVKNDGTGEHFHTHEVKLSEITKMGVTKSDLLINPHLELAENGYFLYQNKPVADAVVYCGVDENDKIGEIRLAYFSDNFNVELAEDFINKRVPDTPESVMPMARDTDLKERAFYNQANPYVYIWRTADDYAIDMLKKNGFQITESKPSRDCIGYHCVRAGKRYTLYLFAGYEPSKIIPEYAEKLLDIDYSKDSTVYILNIVVFNSILKNGEHKYIVMDHNMDTHHAPCFFRLGMLDSKPVFEEIVSPAHRERCFELLDAFNQESTDMYDVIAEKDLAVDVSLIFPNLGQTEGDIAFTVLSALHQYYGDAKLGYIELSQEPDLVYLTLCLKDEAFFMIRLSPRGRISLIRLLPFCAFAKFICGYPMPLDDEYHNKLKDIPALTSAVPILSGNIGEYPIELRFENGERRKFLLPPPPTYKITEEEVHNSYLNPIVIENHMSKYSGYPECGSALTFEGALKEWCISNLFCYLNSEPIADK